MVAFLSDVYRRHAFSPFSSMDLAEYFRQYSGIDLRQDFQDWLFNKAAALETTIPINNQFASLPDLTPPDEILRKYGLEQPRQGIDRGGE
ncbi:MAG: hypothetical protein IH584_08765 [Candidatus Aminicenantes bacterium]|nr:hypothetical protein [Candidatus Aminicenantes bacterium]